MHEYVVDVQSSRAKLPQDDVRDYILASLYRKVDLSNDVPWHFTDSQILRSLQYQFGWNHVGCCSYDCGPIALGKEGFVPHKIVAAHVRRYFAENGHALKSAVTRDERRGCAAGSLQTMYGFPVLYHGLGFYTLAGFQDHKDALAATIEEAEAYLSSII